MVNNDKDRAHEVAVWHMYVDPTWVVTDTRPDTQPHKPASSVYFLECCAANQLYYLKNIYRETKPHVLPNSTDYWSLRMRFSQVSSFKSTESESCTLIISDGNFNYQFQLLMVISTIDSNYIRFNIWSQPINIHQSYIKNK